MKLVFVAGPYRAASEWEVEQNVRRAEALALQLWQLNLAVICPHKNTARYGGALPDQVWLDGALEMAQRCDAVVCVDGWETSAGARGEVGAAQTLEIPVFYSLDEVRQWLKSQA